MAKITGFFLSTALRLDRDVGWLQTVDICLIIEHIMQPTFKLWSILLIVSDITRYEFQIVTNFDLCVEEVIRGTVLPVKRTGSTLSYKFTPY